MAMQQDVSEQKTKRIELYPHQEKALLSPRLYVGLIGGTGGGKTFFGPIWLATEIGQDPTEEYIVVAPTYKLMTRATLPALIETFRSTQLQGELFASKGLYMLPQGGKVWLGTADRPESLEGGQYKAAWLDEAGQMKYMAWVAIQARLGLKRGRALLTTTPYGLNWLYKHFYQLYRKGNANYDVIGFSSIDNPLYPKAEWERAMAELSIELFDMRYRGLFRKMQGLVYPDFTDAEHTCDPFDIPKEWPRRGGTDCGYVNPHVNLKGALDPHTDTLFIFEEFYASRMLLEDIAETMYDMPYRGDPEGKREIEELRQKHHVDIESGETAKMLMIAAVNARVRTKRLVVFNTCVNTLDEVDIYHIDPRTGKPAKVDDHCMDALAQLVWFFDGAHIKRSRVHVSSLPRQFTAFGAENEEEVEDHIKRTMDEARLPPKVQSAVRAGRKRRKEQQVNIATQTPKKESEEKPHVKKKSKVHIG